MLADSLIFRQPMFPCALPARNARGRARLRTLPRATAAHETRLRSSVHAALTRARCEAQGCAVMSRHAQCTRSGEREAPRGTGGLSGEAKADGFGRACTTSERRGAKRGRAGTARSTSGTKARRPRRTLCANLLAPLPSLYARRHGRRGGPRRRDPAARAVRRVYPAGRHGRVGDGHRPGGPPMPPSTIPNRGSRCRLPKRPSPTEGATRASPAPSDDCHDAPPASYSRQQKEGRPRGDLEAGHAHFQALTVVEPLRG